jgi:hypothetical protein
MKKIVAVPFRIKNHVSRHRVAYAASAVAIGAVALQQRNNAAFSAFLEEKGIDPTEFYCPELYQEKLIQS